MPALPPTLLFGSTWVPGFMGFRSSASAAGTPNYCLIRLIQKVHYTTVLAPLRGFSLQNPRPDSGKHAFSVIEGAVKSRAIKGEGFGERGRARVRGVGIYRRGGWPFSSIFHVFLGSFSSCSFYRFFSVFCALLELKIEQNLVKNQFF